MNDEIELPPLPEHPAATDWAWSRDEELAIRAYARAAVIADREGMYEWLAKGERIFRDAGLSFRFGVWWGGRPWRKA